MKRHGLILAGWLGITVGCIGPNHRPAASWVSAPPEHRQEKDYALGEARTVHPGEAMVRVKDYWIQKNYQENVILDQQMIITTASRSILLPHGRVLNNVGAITIDDVDYLRYVDAQDDDGASPLYYFRPDGRLADFLYERGGPGIAKGVEKIIRTQPATLGIPIKSAVELASDRDYVHFALLFQGRSENAVQVDYLEFSPSDPEHPSLTKRVSIPLGKGSFDYHDLRIQVDACSAGEMTFRVASD
ncbi:MAG: hypothetical protein P4L36_12435 [Holophaga sp.]|nr:hypothetical protein [Holophaga sp.]